MPKRYLGLDDSQLIEMVRLVTELTNLAVKRFSQNGKLCGSICPVTSASISLIGLYPTDSKDS